MAICKICKKIIMGREGIEYIVFKGKFYHKRCWDDFTDTVNDILTNEKEKIDFDNVDWGNKDAV